MSLYKSSPEIRVRDRVRYAILSMISLHWQLIVMADENQTHCC